jgi:peptidyl-prolyl cis-trans isomerase A (cyclophilin A)
LTRAPGTYAIFETSQGTITIRLFEKEAPNTVANFIGLAEGTKEFTDARTGQKTKRPFYDGLAFHRVIPKFMIQGGCPLGTGTGDPGYRFADEFHSSLRHDKHTIFGEVVEGQDVATKISQAMRDRSDRPLEAVTLQKVRIERV